VVDKERVLTLFQLFSGRISGEFERISQEKKLVMLNESLDQQVKKRTSELEVALEQLKKTQKNLILNEKMASLGLLTTGIAHEINNPTSYTHTAIYMMNAEVKKIKDFLHQLAGGEQAEREVIQRIDEQFIALNELIKTATNGTLRIKNIVNDLRLFTRKENLNMKNIRLSELINSTVYLVRTQFDAISIVQEFTSDPLISCYPAKLSQVFMNIIANACQAIMAKKRLNQELVGVINIFLSQQKEEVKIVIKDNGLGMSEAIKNQMFDAFFTTKTEEEGTGLGMAISFDIIKEHQGRFEVYSVENEGSEIAIYLPYSITNKK
jgi:signal transduction histidine kinase